MLGIGEVALAGDLINRAGREGKGKKKHHQVERKEGQ